MRITDLQVDGFGVWKGLHVNRLPAEMTVFYGQNEAGKTTLMQFIRSMMFGFAAERREKYLPPIYGGLAGGSAHVKVPSGSFEIQRHVDLQRPDSSVGELTVTDAANGDLYGHAQLTSLLTNIDESIFNNVFAVGLREIQELGALNNTEAAEFLYRLTSGVDRVSLVDVMRDLSRRREELWAATDEDECRVQQLHAQRARLMREIEELRGRTKRWSRIAIQAKEVQQQLQDILTALKQAERESRLTEVAIQIAQRWRHRDALRLQIDALGKLPDPRDVSVSRLDELNQRIVQQRERIGQFQTQREQVKSQAQKLPLDRAIWAQRSRIEALAAHQPWMESLHRQASKAQADCQQAAQAIASELDNLSKQFKFTPHDRSPPAGKSFAALRATGRSLQEQQTRMQQLQDEADRAKFELGQQEKHLGTALADHSGGAPESLDDVNRQVIRLRRRLELEEKINKLQVSRGELEREVDEVVNEQVLPVSKLTAIGIVFVIGVILVGFGLISTLSNGTFWATSAVVERTSEVVQNVGFVFMMLGAVFGFVSLGLKYHWERTAKDELESFRHQMELVRQQLKQARAERDEIDRQLPSKSGQWDLELKDAESRLARLEDLAPLESRAKTARGRVDDLQRRTLIQQRELEKVQKEWQSQLRAAGLSESLTPSQVKEFSQRIHRLSELRQQHQALERDWEDRQKELEQIGRRVRELMLDCQLAADDMDPLRGVRVLEEALDKQRQAIASRQELLGQSRALRAQHQRAQRDLERLQNTRQKHLAAVGVESEDEYRQIDMKHAQRDKLQEQVRQLTEQIAAALGSHLREPDVSPLLETHQQVGLEQRWESLQTEVERLKLEQARLLQLRGEVAQELKALGEDDRLDQARLELHCVDAELQRTLRNWQVLATCSQMLESIREAYEAKRQPETLKEASQYLERLTDGHYVRIWTRLVGEQLLVDMDEGDTITVDRLSRGTREAVYLSLRLALVTAYARRGAVLPLILDDVLVNFDARRARSAARLLADFARNGYQIMMFTCHDHMRDLFHDLGVTVLVLPHHKDVVDHGARLSPYESAASQVPVQPVPTELPAAERKPPLAAPALQLRVDDYDAELEFELSAVTQDEHGASEARHALDRQAVEGLVKIARVAETDDEPDYDEFWPDFPLHRRSA